MFTFNALVYGRRLPCSLDFKGKGIVEVAAGNVPAKLCLSATDAVSLISAIAGCVFPDQALDNPDVGFDSWVSALTQHVGDLVEHLDELTTAADNLQEKVKLVQAAYFLNEAANALATILLPAASEVAADKPTETQH